MIGQLQNNFRVLATTSAVCTAMLSFCLAAHAESVSAEFIATDWVIFVKSENAILTELSRHEHGPMGFTDIKTTFDLDATLDNLDTNYLYIVAGNRHDGIPPYLAGQLRSNKVVFTNSEIISVMDSGYRNGSLPSKMMIEEIISGGFGGGAFTATSPVTGEHRNKPINGVQFASAWSADQNERRGAANVFRIPYSALLTSPPLENDNDDSGGNGEGVTVNVDVNELLDTLLGDKDGSSSNEETTTPDGATEAESVVTSEPEPEIITLPPVVLTEYVQDPDLLKDRDRLLTERTDMVEYIDGLTTVIKGHEGTIRDLRGELSKSKNAASSTLALLQQRDTQIAQLEAGETPQITPPKAAKSPDSSLPLLPLILGGISALGLGGLIGFMSGRNNNRRPVPPPPMIPRMISRDNVKRGMVFAPSQMMVGGSSLPLSLAAIKPVYDAVGRIGFAQNGKPVGKDESFGTGILVSERHILTNRHVWEMFKHRLASDEPTGIEFYGEKKSDKTDFVTFSDVEPVCIDGWDAAIFTLNRAPENRKPVAITPRPAAQLNDLDIVVVGYPQAHRMNDDITEVTEKDPIFGVKRYSEGKIFRHSVDIENPYGVEAAVESVINPSEAMRAICHNASTLGGSSGSAVICKKTGDLIALHFGFDSAYEWEEAANFAVAGENLAEKVAKITNAVTSITDKSST